MFNIAFQLFYSSKMIVVGDKKHSSWTHYASSRGRTYLREHSPGSRCTCEHAEIKARKNVYGRGEVKKRLMVHLRRRGDELTCDITVS